MGHESATLTEFLHDGLRCERLQLKVISDGRQIAPVSFQRQVLDFTLGGTNSATVKDHQRAALGEAFRKSASVGMLLVQLRPGDPRVDAQERPPVAQRSVGYAGAVGAGGRQGRRLIGLSERNASALAPSYNLGQDMPVDIGVDYTAR